MRQRLSDGNNYEYNLSRSTVLVLRIIAGPMSYPRTTNYRNIEDRKDRVLKNSMKRGEH